MGRGKGGGGGEGERKRKRSWVLWKVDRDRKFGWIVLIIALLGGCMKWRALVSGEGDGMDNVRDGGG